MNMLIIRVTHELNPTQSISTSVCLFTTISCAKIHRGKYSATYDVQALLNIYGYQLIFRGQPP